ncbi:MAG: M3 family metallopeptidase [Verrucomicrobia bacterium]|nr:M3 family metallopeptidase [Verrucomicrobiota bacterium]
MHPFLADDFHPRWSTLTAERIVPDLRHALGLAREAIDAICAQDPASATYESAFLALEKATEILGRGWGRLQHLDSVNDHPTQREALNAMLPEVSEFFSSIPLNERLWNVLKAAAERLETRDLGPVRRRFVEETLADFRQAGADLPDEQKQRVAAIDAELSQLTQRYAEHVLDSTNAWELVITDEARLAGLPESAMAAAAAGARAKGHEAPAWRFTLHAPSMIPVMQHLHDSGIRRRIWEAFTAVGSRGEHDNTELVWKILGLRQEKAAILGHGHFADLTLQRRMAKSGSGALDFIEGLHTRVRPAFLAEHRELQHYKAAKTGQPEAPLEPWDFAYWAELQRKENYDFDEESLRPYFPVDGVMSGMFELASRIFGISIRRIDAQYVPPGEAPSGNALPELWHPECSLYEIHDSESGKHMGSFHADWHPREPKRGGAWMNSLQTGGPGEPHLGLICGNMSPPVDGKPALLTHSEVETIFHEFGHLLHGLLSEVPVKSLSGTNVPWDFVELPSQIMENFCWNREALALFARHHETGEPIPEDLFNRMYAARNYHSACAFMRQISFAKLDLELHTRPDAWSGRDLDEVDREILADYRAPLATETPSMIRRFNHLFSEPTGYAAGYYSYKWAEVLDADAFTRFEAEGVLNPETGRAFRANILSQGNSAPPDVLYQQFMGRPPSLEPLLIRSGLAETAMV